MAVVLDAQQRAHSEAADERQAVREETMHGVRTSAHRVHAGLVIAAGYMIRRNLPRSGPLS